MVSRPPIVAPADEFLLEHDRRKDRDHQRRDTREQRAGLRRRRKGEPDIGAQHHRRAAAQGDGDEPAPAEAVERDAMAKHDRHEDRAGDGEAHRRDVPRRQAGPDAEPRHDDVAGPDADTGDAVERTAQIAQRDAVGHWLGSRRLRDDA